MKKIMLALMLAAAGMTISCERMLQEESKTAITANWLKTTPEGLDMMMVALYETDREAVTFSNEESTFFSVLQMDCCTDIMLFHSGPAAIYARLSGATPASYHFKTVWRHFYSLIGKANEIIHAAEELGLEDSVTAKAWGEAKVMRARSYFELYKRYERLYLNTTPTTVDNIDRDFTPSGKEEIFAVIKDDLDDAIEVLGWTDMPGRYHKGVAKHIRAQVAMWEEDYDTAITQCEDIFEDGTWHLMPNTIDCFTGADLVCSENLYVYPFSTNIGGGYYVSGSTGELMGHRLSLITTTRYNKVDGMECSTEYGGYGWGRIYPNSYLLSLYDKEKDRRYKDLFVTEFRYNDPDNVPAGKKLGDLVVPKNATEYVVSLHPYSKKYFDAWTNADQPTRMTSFKDVVLYRLAETYLMCAEAYYHKEGGGSAKAVEYFNKTYVRAGNDPFTGTLKIQNILDEYARECHLEGVRWQLLKRLGMLERVAQYGGDLPSDDPALEEIENLAQMRTNWDRKWYVWPIPQSEIDFMGVENFPQNEGWL